MSNPVTMTCQVQESPVSNGSNSAPAVAVKIPTIPNEATSLQGRVDEKKFAEESRKFQAIESNELQSFLDWMSDQPNMYNYVVVGKGAPTDPTSIKDITTNNDPDVETQAIEEGYVAVPEDDLLAEQFVTSHNLELQQSQGVIAKAMNTFWKALGYK